MTRYPVAVAKRHQADRGGGLSDPGPSVRDACACLDLLHSDQLGAQPHDGSQGNSGTRCDTWSRIDPVRSNADPHQIQPRLGYHERPGRVGQMPEGGLEPGRPGLLVRALERLELYRNRRMARFVGCGKVRPDAHYLESASVLGLGGASQTCCQS